MIPSFFAIAASSTPSSGRVRWRPPCCSRWLVGLRDPIVNCRAPQPVKETLDLLAKRRGSPAGTLQRDWLMQRLIAEEAIELMHAVGFVEVLRRLSRPSYPSHGGDRTGMEQSALVQTG